MSKDALAQEASDLLASKKRCSFETWDEPSGRKAVKLIVVVNRPTLFGSKLRKLKRKIKRFHLGSYSFEKPDFFLFRFNRSNRAVFIFRVQQCDGRDVSTAKDFYEWVVK
jgi:hypothetical protein